MTVASIDIGSNTALLLIAEISAETFKIINAFTVYRVPRVSEGVEASGIINRKREELLLATLEEYQRTIASNNCKTVLAVATNAFRIAKNAGQLVNRINSTFGWDVKIISGNEEARLTFLGAAFPFQNSSRKAVIDIGGGSTEIIFGNEISIDYKNSFPLGVVSIKEIFFKNDPPKPEEVNISADEIDNIIKPLTYLSNPDHVLAVAGTPATLACIKNNIQKYDDSLVDNVTLTLQEIEAFRYKLMEMSSEEVKLKYGELVSGRDDVLLSGTLILERIIRAMKAKQITVSSKGLRYGVVYDYLKSLNNSPGKK